ncbi:2-dehydro-3-deoxygalactonokinase [Rhodalgimonas zhirmunskyi]|uniref:2-dehydro-3-deoxygalactonokinase n=1 Tax=Rhodalgimonas zhirmunskyi TaxID=2964767 RepID=A0AAJ1X5Q1_9RHOB|nr:2-dehydro-3-deoxygalactonokinase [Rhodoalgimonas zhirmunskyi]MDQ2094384.1 2-dehydro-3-deoxygalactonokinase [Rhodoalgimonas zhirmunskyi]
MSTVPAPAKGAGGLDQASPRAHLPAAARGLVADHAQAHPNWDGIVLLPGNVPGDPTHWVHLSAGEIISFQSSLTVRLNTALAGGTTPDMDALDATLSRPERLASHLASAELCKDADAILGHLLGAELASAKPYWLGQEIVLLGESPLLPAYRAALLSQHALLRS